MSVVTDQEIACLHSQRLGRLATVGADGQPHVVPVRLRYNADTDSIDIGGFASRKKRRDVEHSGRASIVVDDVPPPGILAASRYVAPLTLFLRVARRSSPASTRS